MIKKNNFSYPIVIKADGLANGKGVIISQNENETKTTLQKIINEKIFKKSGEKISIEEFLSGYEISVHLFVNKNNYALFPFSQDHKQIFDNDKGPNTGGMGAFLHYLLYQKDYKKK